MNKCPKVTLYKLPWLLKKLFINPILTLITRYSKAFRSILIACHFTSSILSQSARSRGGLHIYNLAH